MVGIKIARHPLPEAATLKGLIGVEVATFVQVRKFFFPLCFNDCEMSVLGKYGDFLFRKTLGKNFNARIPRFQHVATVVRELQGNWRGRSNQSFIHSFF